MHSPLPLCLQWTSSFMSKYWYFLSPCIVIWLQALTSTRSADMAKERVKKEIRSKSFSNARLDILLLWYHSSFDVYGCLIIAREDLTLTQLLGMSVGLSCEERPTRWQVMAYILIGRNLCNETYVTGLAAGERLAHCTRSGTLGLHPAHISIAKCSRIRLSIFNANSFPFSQALYQAIHLLSAIGLKMKASF